MKNYVTRAYADGDILVPGLPKVPNHMLETSRPRTAKKQIEQLTYREIEVLQFVAKGKLNKQTAAELCISVKTIEKHREHLAKKLGIRGIAALTHFAIYNGIIQCDPQLAVA